SQVDDQRDRAGKKSENLACSDAGEPKARNGTEPESHDAAEDDLQESHDDHGRGWNAHVAGAARDRRQDIEEPYDRGAREEGSRVLESKGQHDRVTAKHRVDGR